MELAKIPGPPGPAGVAGPIGPPGPTGQVWRGEYDPATIYFPNDAVSYDGSSYICTSETQGIAPEPDTASYLLPPLANTDHGGSVLKLPPSDQTTWWLRGDNTWQQLPYGPGSGDVTGPASAVVGELAVYSNTTGKLIGRLAQPAGGLVGATAMNLKEDKANKGVVNGYASLDSGGKVPSAQLPPAGTGDVVGPASSVNGQLVLFNDTTGKVLRAALNSGIVVVNSGVQSVVAAPTGAIVGTTDTQTISAKTYSDPVDIHAGISFRGSALLHSDGNTVTSTGGVEQTVWSYNLPAGFLSRYGDCLRFILYHNINAVSNTKRIRIIFNDVTQYEVTQNSASAVHYMHTVMMVRLTQTSQKWIASSVRDGNSTLAEFSTSTHDLNLIIPISLTIFGNGSADAKHQFSSLEFLPIP